MVRPYMSTLPEVFPHVIEVTERQAFVAFHILLAADDEALNGSSFSITSNAPPGKRLLWLSVVSLQRLRASNHVTLQFRTVDSDRNEDETATT